MGMCVSLHLQVFLVFFFGSFASQLFVLSYSNLIVSDLSYFISLLFLDACLLGNKGCGFG